ncbi:MAG TPA: hypothetical protein VH593_21020, partial [Ktedonobacteraceae bacterium]
DIGLLLQSKLPRHVYGGDQRQWFAEMGEKQEQGRQTIGTYRYHLDKEMIGPPHQCQKLGTHHNAVPSLPIASSFPL